MEQLTMAETFAGIGGWSEAAKMAGGIRVVWRSEIHNYKNKVYDLRHPNVPNLGDINTIQHPPYADIFTVSFPCTGISVAGKGEGLAEKGSRLWFEAERIIRSARPKYVVIENGPGLTKRGLARILAGLASIGYDAEWTCLSGKQFDLQHERKRIYIIAYARQIGCEGEYPQGSLFRELKPGTRIHTTGIYPGWATRRDIPQPRHYRSAYDLPSLLHRLECTGDAVIPLIGMYVLECVKLHYQDYLKRATCNQN